MREIDISARETLLLALRLRAQSVAPTDGTIMREAADMIERLIIETGHKRTASHEDLEEAIRFAEIGEYLYSACAYSYGDGYTEPGEFGIEWQWQQSAPGTYGQGALLAASTRWHAEQAENGTVTEAAKLRLSLPAVGDDGIAAARSSSLPSRSSSLEGEGCREDLGIGQREEGGCRDA